LCTPPARPDACCPGPGLVSPRQPTWTPAITWLTGTDRRGRSRHKRCHVAATCCCDMPDTGPCPLLPPDAHPPRAATAYPWLLPLPHCGWVPFAAWQRPWQRWARRGRIPSWATGAAAGSDEPVQAEEVSDEGAEAEGGREAGSEMQEAAEAVAEPDEAEGGRAQHGLPARKAAVEDAAEEHGRAAGRAAAACGAGEAAGAACHGGWAARGRAGHCS
jgi:hypothetical protein